MIKFHRITRDYFDRDLAFNNIVYNKYGRITSDALPITRHLSVNILLSNMINRINQKVQD